MDSPCGPCEQFPCNDVGHIVRVPAWQRLCSCRSVVVAVAVVLAHQQIQGFDGLRASFR